MITNKFKLDYSNVIDNAFVEHFDFNIRQYKHGETFFLIPEKHLAIVLEGAITIEGYLDIDDFKIIALRVASDGEFLNPASVFSPSATEKLQYTVESAVAIVGLIPLDQLRSAKPEIMDRLNKLFIRALVMEISELSETIMHLGTENTKARLRWASKRLSELSIKTTKTRLAVHVGVSSVTCFRALRGKNKNGAYKNV